MCLTPAMRGFSQPETTKPTYEVGLDAAPMWVQYRDATTDGDNCTHVLCGVNSSIYVRPLDTGNCRVSGGGATRSRTKTKCYVAERVGMKGRNATRPRNCFASKGVRGFRGHEQRADRGVRE